MTSWARGEDGGEEVVVPGGQKDRSDAGVWGVCSCVPRAENMERRQRLKSHSKPQLRQRIPAQVPGVASMGKHPAVRPVVYSLLPFCSVEMTQNV